jgi:hypothetical protein
MKNVVIVPFEMLKGKTFQRIDYNNDETKITFYCSDGTVYEQSHERYCCENVWIEDVCGDFSNLLNYPIVEAEEVSNNENSPPEYKRPDDFWLGGWTYYKLSNIKGSVTIRWFGCSNGCSSVDANLFLLSSQEEEEDEKTPLYKEWTHQEWVERIISLERVGE